MTNVIVVDNGCSASSRARVVAEFAGDARVFISEPAPNRGSAVGFGDGIQIALKQGAEYLWLLDDDNWVHPNALYELTRRAQLLPAGSALCSLRTSDVLQYRVAQGEPANAVYPQPGDFFGIDLTRRFLYRGNRRQWRGLAGKRAEQLHLGLSVPFAPYGGFFAHSSTFEKIGLPDREFYLYEDDTDYTERLTREGGRILLVASSIIDDGDGKWIDGEERSGISRLLMASDVRRLRFATRNRARVDFERARRFGRSGRVRMNFIVFSSAVLWRGLTLRRFGRGVTIVECLLKGLRLAIESGRRARQAEVPLSRKRPDLR